MMRKRSIVVILVLLGAALGGSACHYDRNTAGRPEAETGDGLDGSVTATKEGTGDVRAGAGAGQVGTDAPPRSNSTEQPNNAGEKGDATGGQPKRAHPSDK